MSDAGAACAGTWVLLRGLTRESRHWGGFAQSLGTALGPQARVIALDLPGNGVLHAQPSPARVPEMARYCAAALREQGVAPPYKLVAMSLGAMVAAAWAAQPPHPTQEVSHAVLINTSLRPFSPFYWRLRPRVYPTLLRLALRWGGNAAVCEQAVLRLTTRQTAPEAVLADWAAYREQYPVSARNALRQLWAAQRYRAPRAAPAARLLVLSSAHDGLVDPRCSQALARQWQADWAVHPSAGHDLPQDDAAWVAAQIKAWVG